MPRPVSHMQRFQFGILATVLLSAPHAWAQAAYTPYVFTTVAGLYGSEDGPASQARLSGVSSVAAGEAGNVYFVSDSSRVLRKLSASGEVSILAGNNAPAGSVDGTGPAASFSRITSSAADAGGNVFVMDGSAIRKVTPGGLVSTIAGNPDVSGTADGVGAAAQFGSGSDLALDQNGNLYVADTGNTIRVVTPEGVVTTLAGTAGVKGSADGVGAAAQFSGFAGIAVDQAGNVFVADEGNYTVRKITPPGVVTTLAGTAGVNGDNDGQGAAATFSESSALTIDSGGNLLVGQFNGGVRLVTPGGTVSTLFPSGLKGEVEAGSFAEAIYVSTLAADTAGNLYVADAENNMLWKITAGGSVTALAGSSNGFGSANGIGAAARFAQPNAVAVDGSGNVYVADTGNDMIRKITPTGAVTTLAGTPLGYNGGSADGTGSAAQFSQPMGVAVDQSGNVFVADTGNNTIRKITPAGVVTTLAGTPGTGGSADGLGMFAQFSRPAGVAVDQSGNVFVADMNNNTIRRITPAGAVTTLAGTPGSYSGGSADGTGADAQFSHPIAVAVDTNGNVYVADTGTADGLSFFGNYDIRKITSAGVVTTLAGAPYSGTAPIFPDQTPLVTSADGVGAAARFGFPSGVAVDASGTVYVADSTNSTIRKVTAAGAVTTLGGTAGVTGAHDGAGAAAQFNAPSGVAVDSRGNLFVADTTNNLIRVGAANAAPTVPSEPDFSSVPASQSVASGSTVVFRASSSTVPAPGYQWYFDGAPVAGATGAMLVVSGSTGADAGYYDCVATNSLGATTASPATLAVVSTPNPGRLINISVRSSVGIGGNALIGGFVIGGAGTAGSKPVLIRASGPALSAFQVAGVLPDPVLSLYEPNAAAISNSGWAGNSQIAGTAADVGAFPWTDPSSPDSALVETLPGGAYSAIVSGASGDSGVALAEIYDATPEAAYDPSTPRLINISARAQVGRGSNVLIAGFVIGGTTSRTVLIRASGPAIAAAPFNVPGTLPDPQLQLEEASGASVSTVLATNTGWGGDPQIKSAAAAVGAFAWGNSASADSAILATLAPGAYVAEVSGANEDGGVALVEVYEVP
jgi:sugar lactone lactonase YvrE